MSAWLLGARKQCGGDAESGLERRRLNVRCDNVKNRPPGLFGHMQAFEPDLAKRT